MNGMMMIAILQGDILTFKNVEKHGVKDLVFLQ